LRHYFVVAPPDPNRIHDLSKQWQVGVRQLLGAVSEFDKTMLVAKLKAARDRKLAKGQKCGGRKSYAEADPELVALAKQLAAGRKSVRKISAELAARGHSTPRGIPYSASAVKAMQRGSPDSVPTARGR
jgi:DNA invertase Pin-like site-specific DNA recombinase